MRKKIGQLWYASYNGEVSKLEYGISLIDTRFHWQIGTLFMQKM